ncbi:hypothetical protein CEXT_461191 [Caerostris extrusa]|uniref:Uncharacterized protein n=1 Tax=Caerostris extrusa TaxID=172846 RepID=A0AAV4QSS8_CAEEX|nr:hypothetical protein CEXT_461191 [Caerostris extrusa]
MAVPQNSHFAMSRERQGSREEGGGAEMPRREPEQADNWRDADKSNKGKRHRFYFIFVPIIFPFWEPTNIYHSNKSLSKPRSGYPQHSFPPYLNTALGYYNPLKMYIASSTKCFCQISELSWGSLFIFESFVKCNEQSTSFCSCVFEKPYGNDGRKSEVTVFRDILGIPKGIHWYLKTLRCVAII